MKLMMEIPNRAILGSLLIVIMLMATRISITCSIHPVLKRTPRSLLSPKLFPKSYPCPLWSSSFSFCLHTLRKSTSRAPSLSRYCSSLSALSMAASTAVDEPIEANPLIRDFDFPPFDVVEAKHVRPGIRALLKNLVCFVLFFFHVTVFWVILFGFFCFFVIILLCFWVYGFVCSVRVSGFLMLCLHF